MTIQAELLAQLRAERAALQATLDEATDAELAYAPAGRWSAAEILRHLMDFEDDVMQGLRDLAAGRDPAWFAVRDWNAYNAEKARLWADQSVADVRANFVSNRKQLEAALLSLTEEQLADRRNAHGFRSAAMHDHEHTAGVLERLALARGDERAAVVHRVDISRRELLANLSVIPLDAYDERLPGKWSIKEILLHLLTRDQLWTGVVRSVTGGSDAGPHTPEELHTWNERAVAMLAHLPPQQVLYELGAARGAWNQAMLAAPDWLVADERYRRWADMRMEHDRDHLPQIAERIRNWRKRQAK